MVQAGDFKNGLTVAIDGVVHQIIDFQHVKPGKGPAFVRVKIKNIEKGSTVEKTFRPEEKFERAHIEHQDMQYLYNDGTAYHFMDNATYEQIELTDKEVGDSLKFIRENESVKMMVHNGRVIGIDPPLNVELEVTETEPGHRGDTAQGKATKPAFVETGARVNVPLFIEQGEIIKIDTRTGDYVGRAGK